MMPLGQRDRFQLLDGRVGRTLRIEQGPLPVRGCSQADRLAGNPSLLTRLWFVRCRMCVCARTCNDECDCGRDDTRCEQYAETQQRDQHGDGRYDQCDTQCGSRPKAKSCGREAERGKDHQNDVPPCDRTVLGVDQPEIGDHVDHAPRSRGRSKDSWQHGTIISPGFRSNQQPAGRLTGHPVLQI
jgi:hypothetical protein